MKRPSALFAALTLAACASVDRQRTNDVTVSGRIENQSYETIVNPDDLLGHGWITANMTVERVYAGHLAERNIIIRYLAHTYHYGSDPVRLKLRKRPDGSFVVCMKPRETGVHCN